MLAPPTWPSWIWSFWHLVKSTNYEALSCEVFSSLLLLFSFSKDQIFSLAPCLIPPKLSFLLVTQGFRHIKIAYEIVVFKVAYQIVVFKLLIIMLLDENGKTNYRCQQELPKFTYSLISS
jgi:hypothetical protein